MRCRACDCVLSDREATRKNSQTGEYEDLCDYCGGIVAADLAEEAISEVEELDFTKIHGFSSDDSLKGEV